MKLGLIGKKLGMTRVYDDKGESLAVTVVEIFEHNIFEIKNRTKHGLSAVTVAINKKSAKQLNKSDLGQFSAKGLHAFSKLKQFRLADDINDTNAFNFTVSQFSQGDQVDVVGRSKGKGFQGVIKKHGMSGQPMTHGSMMHRRNGAIGMRSTPGRIWKNMGMPGHMGDKNVTVQNLRIHSIKNDQNLLLITGAIPGANNSIVYVKPSVKNRSNNL